MTHARGGLSVQRMGEAPAPRLRFQVFDAIANPPDPVPSKRLDIAKPRSAESGIGHHDGPATLGQNGLQSMQESPVGPGGVVAAHRMHFFVDGNRSPLDRHRGLEDELLVRKRAVGPIDENHRTRDTTQYRPRQGAIDIVSFPMQMTIAEQSVYGLDVVFDEGTSGAVTPEMGQGEPAAAEQSVDDPHQGMLPGLMADDGVALQPFFQQSHCVHAVLSDSDDGAGTTIRSDDSMHVDPLTDCISTISYRNSWRYLRLGR